MKLWNDECGAIISAELVLVMTILGIGMIVGLKAVQLAVVQELNDVAAAVGSINQSYSYAGLANYCGEYGGWTAGSSYTDHGDVCDEEGSVVPVAPVAEVN